MIFVGFLDHLLDFCWIQQKTQQKPNKKPNSWVSGKNPTKIQQNENPTPNKGCAVGLPTPDADNKECEEAAAPASENTETAPAVPNAHLQAPELISVE